MLPRSSLLALALMLPSARPLFGARVAPGLFPSSLARCARCRVPGIRAKATAAPAAPAEEAVESGPSMDEIINVCKRRGIIFQSSEVRNTHRLPPLSAMIGKAED